MQNMQAIDPVLQPAPPMVSETVSQEMAWQATTRLVYDFHWLHEGAARALAGDWGVPLDPGLDVELRCSLAGRFRRSIGIDEHGWLRVKIELASPEPPDARAEVVAVRHRLPSTTLAQLGRLRSQIDERAVEAAERDSTRRLAGSAEGVLFDGAFAFSDRGLRLYYRTRAGDLGWLAGRHPSSFRPLVLSRALRIPRRTPIEVHLPFLDHKQWQTREAWMDAVRICREGSRVVGVLKPADVDRTAYSHAVLVAGAIHLRRTGGPARFTIGVEVSRRARPAEIPPIFGSALDACGFAIETAEMAARHGAQSSDAVDLELSLGIRGDAVSAWLETPPESSAAFHRAFSKVSLAVQGGLRRWLPVMFFDDPGRLENIEIAWPLLVYHASRPQIGTCRADLTQDPLSRETVELVVRSARAALPGALGRLQHLALVSGKHDMMAAYDPERFHKVQAAALRDLQMLRRLLATETSVVDELIRFAGVSRELGRRLDEDASVNPRGLRRQSDEFAARIRKRIRRLPGAGAHFPLGTLLLIEATRALSMDPLVAVLTLRPPAGATRTYVNGALPV